MTVHGAKGLEFKHVFITNLVDKRFPSIGKSDAIELPDKLIKEIIPEGDAHLEEERRLFYVAMTRAKSGLYFSSAEDYGGARRKKLSRFLSELAEDGFALAETPLSASDSLLKKTVPTKRQSLAEQQYLKPPVPQQFSFTQLRDYERCPYQYRFAHVLKIPTVGKPAFSFGKTMHAVMQKFFLLAASRLAIGQKDLFGGKDRVGEITFDELKNIYVELFIDDWYPDKKTKDKYFNQGIESLRGFFDLWQKNQSLAEQLEYRFTFKLSPVCSIRGAIDRIDRVTDGVKIIDYKTGRAKERLSAEDKEQLLLYQIAAEEVLKEPVRELAFYYFDDNSEISFLGTPEEISGLKEKIIATVEEIKTAKFPAKPEKEKCKWCDFKNICDFAL
jgi:DNA helicase-2/ATP-dependent DNA helicase PcrA